MVGWFSIFIVLRTFVVDSRKMVVCRSRCICDYYQAHRGALLHVAVDLPRTEHGVCGCEARGQVRHVPAQPSMRRGSFCFPDTDLSCPPLQQSSTCKPPGPIPGSYLIAQHLIQIPMLVVLSATALTISGYGMCGWNWDAYPEVLLVHLGRFSMLLQACMHSSRSTRHVEGCPVLVAYHPERTENLCSGSLSPRHSLLLFFFDCAAQLFAVTFSHPLLGLFQAGSCSNNVNSVCA